jgi:transposase-like protein
MEDKALKILELVKENKLDPKEALPRIWQLYIDRDLNTKCPFCSSEMKGIEIIHYKCKNCNEYFTN